MRKACLADYDPETIWGPHRPPGVMLVRRRYVRLGADKWDNQRVSELCRVLNETLDEVCARAGIFSRREILKYWKKDKYWPLPIGLHFTYIMNAYFALRFPGENIDTLPYD